MAPEYMVTWCSPAAREHHCPLASRLSRMLPHPPVHVCDARTLRILRVCSRRCARAEGAYIVTAVLAVASSGASARGVGAHARDGGAYDTF